MQLSRVTLVAPGQAASAAVTPALVIDLIWAAADPTDQVEHVAAQGAPGLVEVGIFAQAESPETARRRACLLAKRARDMSPLLGDWRVDCRDGFPCQREGVN
jgi:hypothetical protein